MHAMLVLIFTYIREFIDILTDMIGKFIWEHTQEPLPAITEDEKILLKSTSHLAMLIRTKQLQSERLTRLCVNRMRRVNPLVNAVVDERYIEAIDEARDIDKLIDGGLSEEEFKKKPFLGVPFTVKDSSAAKGMLHTLGLVSRKRIKATEDAECVKVLKEAGAILIATSNIPELNKWQESRNLLFGQTNNPYHTGRTVGGSSGGEGALVSSLASPIGLCTDIGGSTRMPAFYCGLFGHYPTGNTTNMRGATLRTGLEKYTMVSSGVVVKHSEDLIPLMELLTAEKGKNLNLRDPVDLSKLNYFYVPKTGDMTCSSIDPDLQNAMSKVVQNLTKTVAANPPKKVKFEGFKYMYKLWKFWMSKEPADFPLLLGNNKKRVNGFEEIIKKIFGCSNFTLAAIIGLLDLQIMPQAKEEWAVKTTDNLKKELLNLLGKDGILLFHSTTHPAPYHYTCFARPFNFGYWGIFNVLKFPVTQVPLGLNSKGLPLGLQVVAAPGNDRLCIAVAKHLEKEFGGFVPPMTSNN